MPSLSKCVESECLVLAAEERRPVVQEYCTELQHHSARFDGQGRRNRVCHYTVLSRELPCLPLTKRQYIKVGIRGEEGEGEEEGKDGSEKSKKST